MTDTADRTELPSLRGTEPAGADAPAARRRSGSLSTMLLPELQQLAGSLGIATTKKKKADLVNAIQTARAGSGASTAAAPAADRAPAAKNAKTDANGKADRSVPADESAPAAQGVTAAPTATADPSGPAASVAPTERSTAGARSRTRRAASRPTAAPADAAADVVTTPVVVPVAADPAAAPAAEAPPATEPRSQERAPRQNRDNQARDNQGRGDRPERGDQQNRQDRPDRTQDNGGGQQNRQDRQDRQDNNGGPNRGQSNQSNQNRGSGNTSNNTSANNRDNSSANNRDNSSANNRDDDYDDDDGTGRRRGRRYRDRNRNRNRDRQGVPTSNGGGNQNEPEPTVNDDDVLVPIAGIIDAIEDKNTWFVRVNGYFASPEDIFIQNTFVRRFNLRRGDAMTGAVRQLREGERREKYNPLVRLDTVNGSAPTENAKRPEFTKLTPLYPQERLRLETEQNIITTRVIDLVMPIGKGQRALIVSPPKAGKTMVLQAIANAITTNNPECHLMVVLVDERPEEVTDMQRSVKGEVIASTFDRRPQEHTMIAELSIERAKRLVEMGHDVVVLLDSITRLGRAYNLAAPASGRILSGGVDSTALYPPKRFLGAARNIENGGSLTIIATALVETGSAGDTVIFEEYKGTGNAELKLDRKIADKRVFPAVDVDQSSTRKEELLLATDEFQVVMKLRRVLHALDPQQAIDLLTDRLKKTRNNYEFLMQIAKTTPGNGND